MSLIEDLSTLGMLPCKGCRGWMVIMEEAFLLTVFIVEELLARDRF